MEVNMALINTEILRAVMPNIGLPVNPDGTYRIGVEDVNSDEIAVDLAAIEVLNTAILAAIVAGGVGAYVTPTHTAPVIAAATTVALAANANRLYACFANDGTETIYLGLGVAAVMNIGIPILSGGSYEMSREIGNLYVGAVNGICASGGQVLAVTEGV